MYKDKINLLNKRKKVLKNMLEAERLISEETHVQKSSLTYEHFHSVLRELDNAQKIYVMNSVFDIRYIGKFLADIVSEFEGEKYVCQYTSVVHPRLVLNGLNINYKGTERSEICVVVKETSMYPSYKFTFGNDYSLNSIRRLTESGDLLVLGVCYERDVYRKVGKFPIKPGIVNKERNALYDEDCSHIPRLRINLGEFYYLKDFIDMVIDYKIQNNTNNIPFEELKRVFLDSRRDMIDENLANKIRVDVANLKLKKDMFSKYVK